MDRNELRESVRISNDEYDKEQAADFALWKKYDPSKDGPNQWPATFCIDGKDVTISGRPGWHIECSACNLHCFGEQIDLHMGAVDNIFPHHENEIAQTEAYTGKQFSRHWIHGGHLLVNNTKMSKSLKNFFTFRDILTKFPDKKSTLVGRAFRLMVLQTRYRD
jgi:cysteinyl-tRNA synthetase